MSEAEKRGFDRLYLRFTIAVVVVVAALLLRLAMAQYLAIQAPFITFYPAVMVVATLAGFWPGVLATVLASLLADYWIMPPHGFGIARTSDAIALAFFFGMGLFMSVVAEGYRRNQQRTRGYRDQLALRESAEKLRKSEEQFETLANAMPQLCWMANADGWIFWYNQRWYSYTGTAPGEMEGWGWQSVHDPETLPKVNKQWRASISTGEPFDMVFPLRGADGIFRPFLTRVMPVRDAEGKVVRWFGTNTDVSEQKRVEEELRKSKARIEMAVEVADLGEWELDLKDHTASRSLRHDQIFGYKSLLPEWTYEIFLDHVLPQHRAEVEERYKASSISGTWDFETQIRRVDGEVRWIWARGRCLLDEQGQPALMVGTVMDITERKQAESVLQTTLQRFYVILSNMYSGVLLVTDEGRVEFANKAFCDRFGLEDTPADLVGLGPGPMLEKIKNAYQQPHEAIDRIREVLDRGEPVIGEELAMQGGRALIRDFVPLSVDGKSYGRLWLHTDITERKRVEKALQESLAKLDAALASMTDAVFISDATGQFIQYNDAFASFYKFKSRAECALKLSDYPDILDVFTADGELAPLSMWAVPRALRGETATNAEYSLRRKDTGETWVGSYGFSPIRDSHGAIIGSVVVARDITERKQAEDALRKSEERWATTLQSIGDAVISTDATGNIDFMNEVAQTLTGWSQSEAKGQDLGAIFDIVQEVTRIKPESPVAKVIRSGKVVGLANHTVLIGRDGTEIPIEDSAAPIRDRKGQIEGVVLVFHDVSEQRRVELALRNSDRLATTGKLAATIAHEIHNPLDAVGNLLFLIGQGSHDDITRKYISMASGELVRVTQMTHQMLAFQREATKPIPVKIQEILENVIALYERKVKSAGINLELQLDYDNDVVALPGELRQIFANLLGNAVEAVGSRRGTITLRAYSSRDWRHGRPGLRVVVADDGPGIPADVRGKIFEPFFTTKGEGGTGLGLWIASDILRKYDGTMRLRSSTDPRYSGTCFSVFLPCETRRDSPGEC